MGTALAHLRGRYIAKNVSIAWTPKPRDAACRAGMMRTVRPQSTVKVRRRLGPVWASTVVPSGRIAPRDGAATERYRMIGRGGTPG